MGTTATKIPSFCSTPSKADVQLRQLLDALVEATEVRLGRRGDPKDRAITLRELIDSGLAKELLNNPFDPGTGVALPGFETPPAKIETTIPPPPTGLTASGAFTKIILTWDNPQMSNLAYSEVYRSATNFLGDAVRHDTTRAFVWADTVDLNSTYYYWVRHVSTSDIIGPFAGSVTASTAADIGAVMTSLSETLAGLPGYTTLTTLVSTSSAVAARVIRSSGAPSTREDSSALTVNDIWYDTDDGQVHTRNAANNAWVAARDATLVSLYGSTSYTGSTITAAMASAQADIVTVTNAHSSTSTSLSNLTATVTAKTQTFVQDAAPTAISVGDLWVDSNDSNKLYRASATGSSNWVLVRDTVNDGYPRVFTQTGIPTSISAGDIWFDTDDSDKQYRADAAGSDQITSGEWELVRDVTTSAAVTTEATARANADTANATSISNLTATVTAKTQTFVQDAAPTAISVGDLWVDSNDSNKLYRASATGSSNWVLVRDTLNDSYPRVFSQDAIPTSINIGDLWFDTNDSNKQYRANYAGISAIVTSGNGWYLVRDVTTEASVTTLQTATTNLQNDASAAYILQVNANGEVAGMVIEANAYGSGDNSGSAIQFKSDKFAIWSGTGSASSNSVAPFIIQDAPGTSTPTVYIDTVRIRDAAIAAAKIGSLNADVINAGTIAAARITAASIATDRITADHIDFSSLFGSEITLASGGHIKQGQSDFNTGDGFFLGTHSSTAKFSIGKSGAGEHSLSWNGQTLDVLGNLSIEDLFGRNDIYTTGIYGQLSSAAVVASDSDVPQSYTGIDVYEGSGSTTWTTAKSWKMNGTGVIAIGVKAEGYDGSGIEEFMAIRIMKNGTTTGTHEVGTTVIGAADSSPNTQTYGGTSITRLWVNITVAKDDIFYVQMAGVDVDGATAVNRIDEIKCHADFRFGHTWATHNED